MIHSLSPALKIVFAIAATLFCGACSKDDEFTSRPFLMGFTASPYEISQAGTQYTYNKISEEADIINHHFDSGVPWDEALRGEKFSSQMMADWNSRITHADVRQKTFVSVTPINDAHNGLAAYRGSEGDMPLPSPWNTYEFNDEDVKTAYLNYCRRVIDFFQPDYFAMSVETNLLYLKNPDDWSRYLAFHGYVYQQLKRDYPDLPVFSSVAGAPILKGFLAGNDHVQQRLAVMQLLQLSDFYAVSFYPYMSDYLGNPYPENTFDELFSISAKPVVVAETGYTAQTFSMDYGRGMVIVETDALKQQQYIKDLLLASEKWKARFVIYSNIRDYDQRWKQAGSPVDLHVAGRDAGLFDEEGNPRPALNSWREWFRKRVKSDTQPNAVAPTLGRK